MSTKKLREFLAEKLDNKDAFMAKIAVLDMAYEVEETWSNLATRARSGLVGPLQANLRFNTAVSWWAVREEMRLRHGVYETTSVLDYVNSVQRVFAFVSKTDPTKVGYTADSAGGESDRQVIMAPGRLFSKLFPVFSDIQIKVLTEQHNAEACTVVEFLKGPEITKAYTEFGEGVGACMTKDEFNRTGLVHPAELYSRTEGIELAVLRTPEGRYISRCLVRKEEKIYIRVYPGGGVLQRRLESMGFTPGSWHGQKFALIPVDEARREINDTAKVTRTKMAANHNVKFVRVAMPYLDTNNSRNNGELGIAIVGGELRVLSSGTAAKFYERFNWSLPNGAVTNGSIEAPDVTDIIMATCAISGELIDTLSGTDSVPVLVDGVLKQAKPSAVPGEWMAAGLVSTAAPNGGRVHGYCDPATPTFQGRWKRSGPTVKLLDLPVNREACGFYTLDPELYPVDETGSVRYGAGHSVVRNYKLDDLGMWVLSPTFILVEDSRRLAVPEVAVSIGDNQDRVARDATTGTVSFVVHASRVPADATKLHASVRGRSDYAVKSLEVFKTPVGGRTVHPAVNDVTQLMPGVYELSGNVRTDCVLEVTIHELTKTDTDKLRELAAKIDAFNDELIAGSVNSGDGLHRRLLVSTGSSPYYEIRNDNDVRPYCSSYSYGFSSNRLHLMPINTYEKALNAATRYYRNSRLSRTMRRVYNLVQRDLNRIAEMRAQEGPERLYDTVVATEQQPEAVQAVAAVPQAAPVDAVSHAVKMLNAAFSDSGALRPPVPVPPALVDIAAAGFSNVAGINAAVQQFRSELDAVVVVPSNSAPRPISNALHEVVTRADMARAASRMYDTVAQQQGHRIIAADVPAPEEVQEPRFPDAY